MGCDKHKITNEGLINFFKINTKLSKIVTIFFLNFLLDANQFT